MPDLNDASKQKIRHCFNKAAATYDQHSQVQQYVGKKLISLVQTHITQAANIIDLGCGTGLTTEQLATTLRYQYFQAIDIADRLLGIAKQRLSTHAIQTNEQDFDCFAGDKFFDLAFSNFALHWSPHLAQTLSCIYRHLSPA